MAVLTIETLKKLIDNIPDDFTVEYDNKTIIVPIYDTVMIDMSRKKLILG